MAVVLGTNCGFVTTAPTSDPNGASNLITDATSRAQKVVAPESSTKITEIGWWCDNATDDDDFEVGLYDHNAGDNNPEERLFVNTGNFKGTSAGWKTVTVDWAITPETTYWIAMQLDNTATATRIDYDNAAGEKADYLSPFASSLQNPWGSSTGTLERLFAIYAVYEVEAPAGVTRKIKISGTFQDKPIKTKVAGTFVDKPIKIKVGGTFQDA